jgi:hypothetical protein
MGICLFVIITLSFTHYTFYYLLYTLVSSCFICVSNYMAKIMYVSFQSTKRFNFEISTKDKFGVNFIQKSN